MPDRDDPQTSQPADIDTLARHAEEALFDWLENREGPNEADLRTVVLARARALDDELKSCSRSQEWPYR